MIKKGVFLGVLVLLLTAGQISEVWACSGYSHFGVDDLPTMDLLVRATVIDVDDRGFNAIIRVEEYYKGEGPRLLTVMRYPPALASGALVRGYDTGCLYGGRGPHWIKGSQGYFGLRSNGDGTFTDENGGTAHFYPFNGVIQYQEGATEGYAVEMDDPNAITEDEFVNLMLEAGGRDAPILPNTGRPQFYPLMRFLNVTTEMGSRYQVNPDRSIIRWPDDAPIAISPDGAHVAFQIDSDTIAFRYIWTEYMEKGLYDDAPPPELLAALQVSGQAVRFSSDSSFAAVWDTRQMTIVMIRNDGQTLFSGYGMGMRVQPVAHVDFTALADDTLPVVQWSADSTTLVWQDKRGVWHWNLYDSAEPTRFNAAVCERLLDISRHGRYVRCGESEGWSLLDTETGDTYKNTLVSPDERFLWIVLPNQADAEEERNECVPPLRETCYAHPKSSYTFGGDQFQTTFFPYLGNLVGVAACWEQGEGRCHLEGVSWHPAVGDTDWVGGRYIETFVTDLRQIAYDPQYDQPALLVGDYDIYLEFYYDEAVLETQHPEYYDILRLEGKIDSPIESIEWGQPVFYDEYLFTTMEFFPR